MTPTQLSNQELIEKCKEAASIMEDHEHPCACLEKLISRFQKAQKENSELLEDSIRLKLSINKVNTPDLTEAIVEAVKAVLRNEFIYIPDVEVKLRTAINKALNPNP